MRKIGNIIFLSVVLVVGFIYRDTLRNIYLTSINNYFPCRYPIKYSIGTFDQRFGVSEKEFLGALKEAENIWESAIKKDLFNYSQGGELKVNLVYDNRQKTTQDLKSIGGEVESSRASYDRLKAQYDSLMSLYNQTKATYNAKVSDFERRKAEYEAEVLAVNKKGGGNKETVNRLNTERDYLNSQIQSINELQSSLNSQAEAINTLTRTLNSLATKLNLNVKQYNTIGSSLGDEFEEGLYSYDINGRRIDIYQFDNKTKLVRVLAHELGHALGLDHNDDPKAIMYRLNVGTNEKPTTQDIKDLKKLCGIK